MEASSGDDGRAEQSTADANASWDATPVAMAEETICLKSFRVCGFSAMVMSAVPFWNMS